jgi:transcription elongation factor SPT6
VLVFRCGLFLVDKERKKQPERKEIQINHPKFVRVKADEAEKILDDKEVGYYLLRPSSKGPRHLSITWKVAQGKACHIGLITSLYSRCR